MHFFELSLCLIDNYKSQLKSNLKNTLGINNEQNFFNDLKGQKELKESHFHKNSPEEEVRGNFLF